MRRSWALLCRTLLVLAGLVFAADVAILGLCYPPYAIIVLLGAVWRKYQRTWQVSSAFGTAAFAEMRHLVRGRLLGETGLILGRLGFMPRPGRGQAVRALVNPLVKSEQAVGQFHSAFFGPRRAGDGFIRTNDFVHLLTACPAGGGKTVGVLGPNLLSYTGNCVVVDPKGELFRLSAEHRRKKLGHEIVRIDPAMLCGPGAHCFNPLDWIDPRAMDFVDVCRDLANMLVVRSGLEHEPHFNDSAENNVAAFLAYVCACEGNPDARNLRGVRTLLASRQEYTESLTRMQVNKDFYGILQQLGHSLTWHVDRELGSVMSTTQRHTNIFDSPLIARATQHTTFDPRALRNGRGMTVYLIVPAEKLVIWAPFQRMILGSLLRIATRGVPTERNPLLFMIDEAAHIGQMQALETAITALRGSGIRIWLFMQSLDQLKKCFGDNAQTVLDNLGTQQYFGINSYETAEALSKKMGDSTIAIQSTNTNDGTSRPMGGGGGNNQSTGSWSSGRGWTTSEHGRPLFRPDEILRMPANLALVFHKNLPVIPAERIYYFADPAFRRRWLWGYGTGRSRGLGFGALVLALIPLLLSVVATVAVARLILPPSHWRAAVVAVGSCFEPETAHGFVEQFGGPVPAPFNPWQQPSFMEPAPYRSGTGTYGQYPGQRRRTRRSYP